MPLPQIAIEIAAPARAMAGPARPSAPESADLRRALLASCDAAAARAAECVIADTEQEAAVLALVFWRGPTHIRVEVGLGSRRAPWAIRELEFSSRDPDVEKWRTVGYTLGSLAMEALAAKEHPGRDGAAAVPGTGAAAAPPGTAEAAGTGGGETGNAAGPDRAGATSAATAPPPQKPNEARSVEKEPGDAQRARDAGVQPASTELESRPWGITASALLGPGLGSVRVGGSLRVNRAFRGPYATAAGAYSIDATDSLGVSAQRFALSAGGGYEWVAGGSFAIAVRGELMAEFLDAHVDEAGRSDERSRWSAALNLGAEVVRRVTGPFAVVAGVDTTIRTNRTDIQVRNANVASVPMADVVALVGARVTLR